MKNEIISLEIKKIFEDPKLAYPQNLALACSWVILQYKGENLKILDLRGVSSVADFFVLADAKNNLQIETMTHSLEHNIKDYGHSKLGTEAAHGESLWALIDFGSVMVHLFTEESRQFYKLESLWPLAPTLQIPESYYFTARETEVAGEGKKVDSLEGYF
jgi:ribosome-associated protein